MMLSPDNRSVYTDALTPPTGFQLDTAVAATFSMDLTTLLSVPLQLVLQSTEDSSELMRDPISLYEALQRATERVHVFVQHGRTQAPKTDHLLYSLLEPMITEVVAPRGGAFHPKLWALRFTSATGDETQYRLLLASKNLTTDRCWDVALSLDGYSDSPSEANGLEIADFVAGLPSLAAASFVPGTGFGSLVEELRRVRWELPEGFDTLRFHVLGLDEYRWKPPPSRRLVVISPFISSKALQALSATSEIPLAVISRSNSLAELNGSTGFEQTFVLHDAAETEDGESNPEHQHEIGLHAKAYMGQEKQVTHLTIGSANATDAALVACKNVEILAELSGPTYKVGSVLNFMNPDQKDGLGQFLVAWEPGADEPGSAEQKANEQILESARDSLLRSGLSLHCHKEEDWVLEMSAETRPQLPGLKKLVTWPVTVGADRAVDATSLAEGESVRLPVQAISSLTALIALRLEAGGESLSFTMSLPVTGMPEERDRAILRSVVKNRQGFLRYLLLLLAGLGDGADIGAVARAFGRSGEPTGKGAFDDVPLLEELVRAFARDRKRLEKVERLIADIADDGDADQILPDGFLNFWQVFRQAVSNG